MAWIYLTVAGLLEVGWAIGLKYTDGFTRLLPSLWTITSMILSIVLLGLALKTLAVGTAYAVWTGIGAVGTAALGIYLAAGGQSRRAVKSLRYFNPIVTTPWPLPPFWARSLRHFVVTHVWLQEHACCGGKDHRKSDKIWHGQTFAEDYH